MGYFTRVVKYVTDILAVKIELYGITSSEGFFLIVFNLLLVGFRQKIATNRHIQKIGSRRLYFGNNHFYIKKSFAQPFALQMKNI